jgi:CheY-like chemotaxis protein
MDKNKKWTILVVDDEEEIRRATSNMFERAGFEVSQAENGVEALKIINRDKPDMILLDGMMPEMTGFEVYKAVKSNPQTRDVPVILCSAADKEEILKNNVNPDDYIQKPIQFQKLYQKVIKILGLDSVSP